MTSQKSTLSQFAPSALSLAVTTVLTTLALPTMAQTDDFDFALEEIVVTAQKRAESVDDVPITINAFAADGIRDLGAQNVNDLGTFIPGVETNVGDTSQASFSIRGISTNDFGSGSDPAVAVYVDGVYTGHGGSALFNFNDIDRVEVLKGPQGTLFGRNAAAGAISITTKAPSQETEGYADVQMGNFNKQKISLGFNTGLTDTLALRVSGYVNSRDGIIKNASTNGIAGDTLWIEEDQGLVAALLWQPSENTDITLRTDYNQDDSDGPIGSSFTLTDSEDELYDNYTTDNAGYNDRIIRGTSLTISHAMDDYTFTSITAKRGYEFHQNEEEDGTDKTRFFLTTDTIEKQSQFSQEFRLNYEDENLKWFLGASYFKDQIDQTYLVDATTLTLDTFFLVDAAKKLGIENPAGFVDNPPPPYDTVFTVGNGMGGFLTSPGGIVDQLNAGLAPFGLGMGATDIANAVGANLGVGGRPWQEAMHNSRELTSYAVYGDVTYSFTDRLDATFGLRWSKDSKDFEIQSNYTNAILIPTLSGPATGGASVSTDILALSSPLIPTQIPFGLIFFDEIGTAGNPEKKNDSWSSVDPRLVVNYAMTDDVMLFGSIAKGYKAGGFNSLGDDPSFENEDVLNLEVGVKSKLMDGRMRLNASVYQFEYDNLQILKLSGPAGVIPTYNIKNADAIGQGFEFEWQFMATENLMLGANYGYVTTEYTRYEQFEGDAPGFTLKGEPLSSMPENKFNAMAEYSMHFADDLVLRLRGDYNYTGERVNNSGVGAGQDIEDFQVINARATLENSAGDWSVALYANNLLDEEYLWDIGGTGDGLGSPVATRGMPLMYGVQARYNF